MGLSEDQLEAIGVEPLNVPSRPFRQFKQLLLGLLIATLLMGLGLAGCRYTLGQAFDPGKTVVTTSIDKYAENIARETWAPRMPQALPANGTDARFRLSKNTGWPSHYTVQLGVTLPHDEVVALLTANQQHSFPYPNIWASGSEPSHPQFWEQAQKFVYAQPFNAEQFEGIAIDAQTNRVVWFAEQSSN